MPHQESKFPNNFLNDIQKALVSKEVLEIEYHSGREEQTKRKVEPIGIQYYSGAWHLIGYCRLREGYRDFRADRITTLVPTGQKFDNHNLISFQEYLHSLLQSHHELQKAVVILDKTIFKYRRYIYGFVSEEDLGDKVRMTFLVENFNWLARWLLSFGGDVEVESPEPLRQRMCELADELYNHYDAAGVNRSAAIQ
jgi:predicted DNA-binding transcriptional regulator YafY